MSSLRALIVGSLSFVVLVLNTAFWLPFLLLVAAVRALLPWRPVARACRRAAHFIAESWIALNVLGLKAGGRIQWDVTNPGGLRHDAWYLVTSNHVSEVDIVIVQWLFNRRIPLLKFFLKRELIWVPGLGIAWWALEFPFMRRHSKATLERHPHLRQQDLDTTRAACERFRELPTTALNFVEGTRFTEAKRDRQDSPFAHLLLPKAGGVAQVVSSLGDRLDAWLDVTIVYPAGTPTFWELISGQIPRVRVHIEKVPFDRSWTGRDYLRDESFRHSFQSFLRELWKRKDERIETMLHGEPAAPVHLSGRSATTGSTRAAGRDGT